MEYASLIRKLELSFLTRTVDLIKKNRIHLLEAQELAKELLGLLPFQSITDVQEKVKAFTDKHPDYGNLLVETLAFIDKNKSHNAVTTMETHIENKNIDKALNVMS